MKKISILVLCAFFLFVIFLVTQINKLLEKKLETNNNRSMKLTSPAFGDQLVIPGKYTCNGENISPPLHIENVTQNTKSLVLIVDDPDAPMGTWVHWVVYNINPAVADIGANSVPKDGIPANTSFGKPKYGGPCPPSGQHRYFFKLYALDETLLFDKPDQVDKHMVEEKMRNHIIDQTELVGLYSQKK